METTQDYTISIPLETSKQELFSALNENLGQWWGTISNSNFKEGGRFTVTFENDYWWTFQILEFTPNEELIWKCIDGEPDFNKEWIGHVLHWSIIEVNHKTVLKFHQAGLNPTVDCYEICSTTWDRFLVKELKQFLAQRNLPKLN
ncbi:SRPBCC domain-containing protein [Winogradskyella sp. 3972H.M.0a.05]|uniref:SRPBCC family protein n=1 Tax=Winogradskyella sp. 3972H.M.0a.05 TaxID=2950277 RepID=UPI0033946F83